MPTSKYFSKLGLTFVALYLIFSAASICFALQTSNFKSLAVWLSAPIGFVPEVVFTVIPNFEHQELLSNKEAFLVRLISHYPIGIAFMAIFLYALGWCISNAYQASTAFSHKFTATLLSAYFLGCFVFDKSFVISWPLFVLIGCVVSWRASVYKR